MKRSNNAGAPAGLTAMPVAGVSTPVTIEGFIVVSSAEHLATWIAARALQHLARPIEPTTQKIALPSIEEVGIGLGTSHLETAHTVHNYRACLWFPELIERTGWNGFNNERQILDKAQRKVTALTEAYIKPEDRAQKLEAMRVVVEKASQALLQ